MSYSPGQYDIERSKETDQEPASHYYRGGYHVLHLGEMLNRRYLILRKIGWDELSTNWLAKDGDTHGYVTVNIYKSSEPYTEHAVNLIRTFNKIQQQPCDRIMQLLDHFQVTGFNGTHICTVTEVMTECLNNYMIRQSFKPTPIGKSKTIVKHVLEGLHHLHTNSKMIHTNIKPETIFFKANKTYLMGLLYGIYIAIRRSSVPPSFLCNLPTRLSHHRTKMTTIEPQILLQDEDFAAFVERMGHSTNIIGPELDGNPVQLEYVLSHWIGKARGGCHIHQSPQEEPGSETAPAEEINSLIGRISRYLKCKIIDQTLSQKYAHAQHFVSKTRYCSTRTSSSSGSKYRSTNYERNTSSSSRTSTSTGGNSVSERKGTPEESVTFIKKASISYEEVEESLINVVEVVGKAEQAANSSNDAMSSKEISEDISSADLKHLGHLKDMELYLAEAIIERWYKMHDKRIQEISDKCHEIQAEMDKRSQSVPGNKNESSSFEEYNEKTDEDRKDLDKDIQASLDVKITNKDRKEEIDGEITDTDTLPDIKDDFAATHDLIDVAMDKEDQEDNEYTGDLENTEDTKSKTEETISDFLDDIKTSPEISEDEVMQASQNVEKAPCECRECENRSLSSKSDRSSEEASSYSTSTSTQDSYTEFFLRYCRHNTLCTEFSKYVNELASPAESDSEEDIEIVIGDLANVRSVADVTICKEDVQRQYRAVELIYKTDFDAKIDIWSVGCLTFELVTGDFMFNPTESKYYTIDEHHLLKAIQLLAEIPPDLLDQERSIRNIKLLLERDRDIIDSMNARENFYRTFHKSYGFPATDAKRLSRFLVPMMQLNPAKRVNAQQCLDNDWLKV